MQDISVESVTFRDLVHKVKSHSDGLQFLMKVGLINPPVFCEMCGAVLSKCIDEKLADGFYFRCPKSRCRSSYSIRHKSLFRSIMLSLDLVVMLAYMWCFNFSPKQIKRELDLPSQTISSYCKMFRELCSMEYHTTNKIGGPGIVIQIDESHMFTRKSNKGRLLKMRCWVFGGIDESGNVFIERVEQRDSETLVPLLLKKVESRSIIFSDSWRAYSRINLHFEHHQVNHSQNFVNPVDGTNTQRIEAIWGVLKRMLKMKGSRLCKNIDGTFPSSFSGDSTNHHHSLPLFSWLRSTPGQMHTSSLVYLRLSYLNTK